MPKGFTEDGRPILTKDEVLEMMLTQRGYEKNADGAWELVYPELNIPKVKNSENVKSTVKTQTPVKSAIAPSKPETLKPKKAETAKITKDTIIANVSQFLTDEKYSFTADKAIFMVICGNETYELKITRKTAAFEFISEFEGVKDFGKQKFINQLQNLKFCEIGIIDKKGTVGFTDNKEFITVTITKKRT